MSKINKHIQLNFGYGNGRFEYTYNSHNPNEKDLIDNFLKWLKNKSIFRMNYMNYNMIIRNLNYLSYLYLIRSNDASVNLTLKPEQEEYISNNYSDVIQELDTFGSVIVSYAIIHQEERLNNEFDCVEILESRIRNLGLATYLLKSYEDFSKRHVIPRVISFEISVTFWEKYFIYTNFEDELFDENKEAKKYLSPQFQPYNKLKYEILKIRRYRSLVNEIIKEYVYKKFNNDEIRYLYKIIFDKFISNYFHNHKCRDKESIIEYLKPLINNLDKIWDFALKKYSLNEVEKVQFK